VVVRVPHTLLFKLQAEYNEARKAYERSLAIRKRAFGETHADVAQSLHDLAVLLWRMGRFDEAISLQERAIAIHRLRGETSKAAKYSLGLAKLRAGEACPYRLRVSQFDASVVNPLLNLV